MAPCLMFFVLAPFFLLRLVASFAGDIDEFLIGELALFRVETGEGTIGVRVGKDDPFLMRHQGEFLGEFCLRG